jgi:SAM-dependent methyltransferase
MSAAVPLTADLIECGFHDAECAGYLADLPLWLSLAETVKGPVLDLGAGTGRVTLPLAAQGYDVTAVDLESALVDELARRAAAQGLSVRTATADLRTLDAQLDPAIPKAALVIIPMQTIQLLGGPEQRRAMFRAIAKVCAPGAELVISVVPEVESFDGRGLTTYLLPPDVATLDGYRFESTPLAVLQEEPGTPVDMHRQRLVIGPEGEIVRGPDDVVITLDPVNVMGLQAEALAGEWIAGEVIPVAETDEHAGGNVLVFWQPAPLGGGRA